MGASRLSYLTWLGRPDISFYPWRFATLSWTHLCMTIACSVAGIDLYFQCCNQFQLNHSIIEALSLKAKWITHNKKVTRYQYLHTKLSLANIICAHQLPQCSNKSRYEVIPIVAVHDYPKYILNASLFEVNIHKGSRISHISWFIIWRHSNNRAKSPLSPFLKERPESPTLSRNGLL